MRRESRPCRRDTLRGEHGCRRGCWQVGPMYQGQERQPVYLIGVVREFDHLSRIRILLLSNMGLLELNEPLRTEDVNMRRGGEMEIPSGGCSRVEFHGVRWLAPGPSVFCTQEADGGLAHNKDRGRLSLPDAPSSRPSSSSSLPVLLLDSHVHHRVEEP